MKFTMKLKEFLNLKVILVLALLGLGVSQAMAANRTFTLKATDGGKVQYRVGTSGSYSNVPESNTITVADGKKLYLKAVVTGEGYYFTKWSGKSTSTNATINFTVSATTAGTYTANFSDQYTLTLTANPTAGGTLTGGGPHSYNSSVLVSATPNNNYVFDCWTLNGAVVSYDVNYGIKMPDHNVTLVANFTHYTTDAQPINGYYYFDLTAGPVTINENAFYGYRFDGTTTRKLIAGTHNPNNQYYVYQSQKMDATNSSTYYSNTGYFDGTMHLPQYPEVTYNGMTWAEYITDAPSRDVTVENIIENWPDAAAAAGRTYTRYGDGLTGDDRFNLEYRIKVWGNVGTVNLTVDNIYTRYHDYKNPYASSAYHGLRDRRDNDGGIYFEPGLSANGNVMNLNLVGDNRVGTLWYRNSSAEEYRNNKLVIDGTGSITACAADETYQRTADEGDINDSEHYMPGYCANHWGAAIGTAHHGMRDAYGIEINGGVIYAGTTAGDNSTAIGGGGNAYGKIDINGGTVTAVSATTGSAIGGGIGWDGQGGIGVVNITGGVTYAYNINPRTIPSAAIGGGSSANYYGREGYVNIYGGDVYAVSMQGTAIGGGSARHMWGGEGNVEICGGNIVARSIKNNYGNPGCGIGGGTGCSSGVLLFYDEEHTNPKPYYGGSANVHIYNNTEVTPATVPTILTGSIGGGKSGFQGDGTFEAGKIGSAQILVEGGDTQAQFVLAAGAEVAPSFTMTGGLVHNSDARQTDPDDTYFHIQPDGYGGAVYMEDGTCSIEGGTIENCAGSNGGAIYMTNGTFTMTGGTIGGASIDDGNTANGYGGALFMGGGSFKMEGGNIQYNAATANDGGGIYIASGGTVEINGGTIEGNQALNGNGGGFFVNPGASKTTIINSDNGNTLITGNTAKNGGGAFVGSGKLDVASTNGNTVSICYNTATVNGGGIYADHDVEIDGITVCNNSAVDGGGLYVEDGEIKVKNGCDIKENTATRNGGGIFANNDVNVSNSTINENVAVNGGGLYAHAGTVDFSSGTFSSNSVSGNGGGLYVANGATVLLSGTATLTKNHVPYANGENIGHGGGIYLAGTVKVGRNAGDPQGTHSLNVQDNYQDTESNLNNIYLAGDNNVIELLSDMRNSSTKLGFSVNSGFRKVVYHAGDATDETNSWLHGLLTEGGTQGLTGVIFDDSRKYMAVHVLTLTDQTFDHEYIYLWGCWISAVDKDPQDHLDEYPLPSGVASHYTIDTDGTWHIWTKEGLAWFSSYVNGLNAYSNGYKENVNAAAKAVMEADVDMNEYLWVPLGSAASFDPTSTDPTSAIFTDGHKFKGEFNGKGHIIRGLDCRYINSIHNYGLFGETNGNAKITNTFVDGARFDSNEETGIYHMGGIAGTAKGNTVIANCEARGTLKAPKSDVSALGSLVGVLDENAVVHSSIGVADMSGKAAQMGGLVGQITANAKLVNSFSNATYTPSAGSTATIGGLAGTNNGTIENCYVASLRGTMPSGFAWFAGGGTGTVNYCYAPEGTADGTNSVYGTTARENEKYGYAHTDQQITTNGSNSHIVNGAISNKGELGGLLATLNHWVKHTDNGWNADTQTNSNGYSIWTRTMASPMNDDYPILEFDDFVSAASNDNIFIAYRDDLNEMIAYANGNTDGGNIYLYGEARDVNTSTNSNVRVYIGPNVGLTQDDDNTLNARVGVTLDNSSTDFMAYDWHMFSSALATAPMGIVYPTSLAGYHVYDNYSTYKADGIPDEIYNSSYPDPNYMEAPATSWNTTAGSIGYFPTNTAFGAFDFYCYEEGVRHWINFKRQGNSGFYDHWHQDADENGMHQNIAYPNEDDMEVGKGYMVAITAPSMLMTDGVLNNGATSRTASYTAGGTYDYPLRGVNLVGNPYQSYLDFNVFANKNGFDTYYILDADKQGYIAYTTGATPQVSDWPNGVKSYTADQYIHPHQGFFVRVTETQDIEFNNEMRVAGPNSSFESDYRDWEPRYALVNMVCSDGRGRNDFATIELDRPELGGGKKVKGLRSGDASIWFRLGEEDYHIAFAPVGTTSAPLRFEAHTDGVYTLSWNTQNGNFSYLHLIDNLTGADIDCLMADEYRFEATTHDYTSRFRLVFDFTGVEENDEPTEGPTSFAFMMGDELVINGEGVLQMFDLNGRQLFSTEIHGIQASVAMPKVADGIYVLRLTNGNQVRTQKMVINK